MTRFKKNPAGSAPPPAPAPAGRVTLEDLARELGVSVATIFQIAEAMDLSYIDAAGLQLIRDSVADRMKGAPLIPATAALAAILVVTPPLRRVDLRLTRIFAWSRSGNVLAALPNGNEVVLTVRRDRVAHLLPGMVLSGCIEGVNGWTYEGRLPRSIGERQLFFPAAPTLKDSP